MEHTTQKANDHNIDFLYIDLICEKLFDFLKTAIFLTSVCSRPSLPSDESNVIIVKPKKNKPASTRPSDLAIIKFIKNIEITAKPFTHIDRPAP